MMEKYFEINRSSQNIRCKLYYDKRNEIRKAVLYGHGFAGHKDNGTAKKFAERVLTRYKGIAVVTFDLPCHGDDVKRKLVLQDCTAYLDIVVHYVKEELGAEELYSYATSFGGYLVLKYIKEFGNPFVRIALRCPVINMHDVLTHTIVNDDELAKIIKGKDVPVGFDRKINISRKFLEEVAASDLTDESFLDYCESILILHGTEDEISPFDVSSTFADRNIIEFIPVEGADHRFQNSRHMETATKEILDFFGFSNK